MKNFHNTTTDYTGRTVDLLLLKTVLTPSRDVIVDANVPKSPHSVTGIEKLVQRYALLFLTQLGSIRNRPSEGTELMIKLRRGQLLDESSVRAEAALANRTVMKQIRSEDNSLDTPPDEALASSEVKDVTVDRTSSEITITVSLTTESGETYVYVTPLPKGI